MQSQNEAANINSCQIFPVLINNGNYVFQFNYWYRTSWRSLNVSNMTHIITMAMTTSPVLSRCHFKFSFNLLLLVFTIITIVFLVNIAVLLVVISPIDLFQCYSFNIILTIIFKYYRHSTVVIFIAIVSLRTFFVSEIKK